jgi:hypothetical protein
MVFIPPNSPSDVGAQLMEMAEKWNRHEIVTDKDMEAFAYEDGSLC